MDIQHCQVKEVVSDFPTNPLHGDLFQQFQSPSTKIKMDWRELTITLEGPAKKNDSPSTSTTEIHMIRDTQKPNFRKKWSDS